ncbi:MAG: hypothetical protein ACRD1C_13290 [Terriglobales bacterium]
MRRLQLVFTLALCAGTAAAQMTAQQVVDHSLAARGGAAAFAAVRTLSFSGELEVPGAPAAAMAVWIATRPARIRIEITFPQGKMTEGFDGATAWHQLPGAAAVALTGADANRVQDQANNGVDLIADSSLSLKLAGTGTLQGHKYYAVTFTLPTGDRFTQYFDAHTWLVFHEIYPGGSEDISGYQPAGGLLLPTKYVSGPTGQAPVTLLRQHTEINPEIPVSRFARPLAAVAPLCTVAKIDAKGCEIRHGGPPPGKHAGAAPAPGPPRRLRLGVGARRSVGLGPRAPNPTRA